jgi:hypothetical protein
VVPLDVLGNHLVALMLTWTCAWGTGLPLAWLLRLRVGFAGGAILGVAYWAAALYCLSFAGGLAIAAIVAGLLLAATLCQPRAWRALRQSLYGLSRADVVLGLGCAAYASIVATQFVPPGMDASMHTMAARLIAQEWGMPTTYAPFAPDLPFPPVTLGLPAFCGVVIRMGADPASAMLACEQLTFSAFLLGTYLVLRLWTTRMGAAFPALVAAWSARNAQETAGWGGFPTVMSMALGLLATRLLFDLARRPRAGTAVALGLLIGAMPLVHGAGAGSWLYCIAPVAGVVALLWSRRRSAALRHLLLAGGVCGIILAACVIGSRPVPSEPQREFMREWHRGFAPTGEGWALALSAPNYVKTGAGSLSIYVGFLGALVLLIRGRFVPVIAAIAVTMLVSLVAANARYDALPGSFLLFPERVVYLAPPLAALMMALGWRALPSALRGTPLVRWGVPLALLGLTLPRQYNHFQRIAWTPMISADGWAALCWAREHLDPQHTYVAAPYNSTGSYLPSVAGIACSGWAMHYLCFRDELRAYDHRPPTHVFIELAAGGHVDPGSTIVYQRGAIVLCELPQRVSTNSP